MNPDLESLYSQLDLRPNCGLEEFQRAYRRRIAELHPDRSGTEPRSAEAQALLRNLIWMYDAVSRFHRRYGRMPGGHAPGLASRSPYVSGNHSRQVATSRRMSFPVVARADDSDKRPARTTLTLMILFVVLLVLLSSWGWFAAK